MSTRTNAPEGFFLQQLFQRFNASSIRYAVMRNHEALPFSAGNSDLDLLVARQDGERTKALLYDAIQEAGGVALGISEAPGFFKVFAFGQNSEGGESWWGQCIDVNVGLFFKGQSLLTDYEPWLVSSFRGITVLADGFAAVLGVLKEVLNNSTFADRYASAAREGFVQDWPSIKRLLAPMGNDSLEQLRALILSDVPSDRRAAECQQWRKVFLRHAMMDHPIEYFMGMVAYEWSKVRRYVKPSGMVIAFLGVDGAGKSTIINAIKPVLDAATHNATVVQHLRPGLLPPLARLKGKSGIPSGPVIEPHGSEPSGALGSLFRLIYLMLDYVLGYWFLIRRHIAKQPTLVIFDRYAYDLEIDPRRFRIALPTKIIRWFTRFAPKPDLIISLHCAPELIVIRKQELSLAEISRQVDALREFSEKEHRAILISTDECVEEVRDQIFEVLGRLCSERNDTNLCRWL